MDIREFRRQRLYLLLETVGGASRGSRTRLAHKVGKASAQITQWLNNDRTIDEQSARDMENFARLPERWFDTPSPHEQEPTFETSTPLLAGEPNPQYVVQQLGQLLTEVAASKRGELAQLLGVFTTSGGDPDYEQRLVKLLGGQALAQSRKRAANGKLAAQVCTVITLPSPRIHKAEDRQPAPTTTCRVLRLPDRTSATKSSDRY